MDCTLASTGAPDPVVTLVVAALLIAAGGLVLWRLRARAEIGVLVALGALALALGTPAPSMAAPSGSCATPTPEPQATLSASPGSLVDIFTVPGDSIAIVVTNSSTVPADDLTAAMRDGLDFVVGSTTCGATLAPGSSCTVTVGMIIGPGHLNDELRISASNANTLVVLVAISQ